SEWLVDAEIIGVTCPNRKDQARPAVEVARPDQSGCGDRGFGVFAGAVAAARGSDRGHQYLRDGGLAIFAGAPGASGGEEPLLAGGIHRLFVPQTLLRFDPQPVSSSFADPGSEVSAHRVDRKTSGAGACQPDCASAVSGAEGAAEGAFYAERFGA